MEEIKYTPKDKDVKTYIKQIKLVPTLFFCKDENYFSSKLYLNSASAIAKESSYKNAKKKIKNIMKITRKDKKDINFNINNFYEKQLESLQVESKNYGKFIKSIDKLVAEKKGEDFNENSKLITPNKIFVDATLKLIKKYPSLFMGVNTEFFTSKEFLKKAPNIAMTEFEKAVDINVKQASSNKKTSPEIKASIIQENSQIRSTFNNSVKQKIEDETYNIRHNSFER